MVGWSTLRVGLGPPLPRWGGQHTTFNIPPDADQRASLRCRRMHARSDAGAGGGVLSARVAPHAAPNRVRAVSPGVLHRVGALGWAVLGWALATDFAVGPSSRRFEPETDRRL